ncbi:MAG: hypothetical protein ACREBR_01840, partial [bacterium]
MAAHKSPSKFITIGLHRVAMIISWPRTNFIWGWPTPEISEYFEDKMDGWPTDELRAENFSNGNGRAKIRCPAGRQIDELQAEDYAGEKVSAGRIGHRWPMDD